MNFLLWIHIAAGSLGVLLGAIAVTARKGGLLHARSGTWFFAAMLVLGVTATILERSKAEPELGVGGVFTVYFVATSWVAARRRDGTTGKFEILACAVALAAGALLMWGGLNGAETPLGSGPVFALAGVCLLAGLLDLKVILSKRLSPAQRITRHLWRMCFGFFIATGSFFLGEQVPAAIRGSPFLFIPALAPLAVMAFWLVRMRLGKWLGSPIRSLRERPA